MRMTRLAAMLLTSALLAACAAPTPGSWPETEAPGRESPGSSPAGATATSGVVTRLLAQARRAEAVGDLSGTEANLERALRIEPRNPRLWHYMARLRVAQKAYGEAASLAAKSNSLARGDRHLLHDNWRLISQALTLQGDTAGAQAAAARASEFR